MSSARDATPSDLSLAHARVAQRSLVGAWLELFKLRVAVMVVVRAATRGAL